LTKATPKYSICEAEAVAQKSFGGRLVAESIALQTDVDGETQYLQKQTVPLAAGALLLRGGELP
jgi:hypothetical protein